MSKGSSRRPAKVTNDKFSDSWDKIFNKPLNNQEDSTCDRQERTSGHNKSASGEDATGKPSLY